MILCPLCDVFLAPGQECAHVLVQDNGIVRTSKHYRDALAAWKEEQEPPNEIEQAQDYSDDLEGCEGDWE
jgi:hypothetical protein